MTAFDAILAVIVHVVLWVAYAFFALLAVYGVVLFVIVRAESRERWREDLAFAKLRHPSNQDRVADTVTDTYTSTDAVGVRIAEHFCTTERVIRPRPVAPTTGRSVSGDPAYGCEVRWESELFDDPDFTVAARFFGVRQESR